MGGNHIGNGETIIEMNERGELEELIAEYKVCERRVLCFQSRVQ